MQGWICDVHNSQWTVPYGKISLPDFVVSIKLSSADKNEELQGYPLHVLMVCVGFQRKIKYFFKNTGGVSEDSLWLKTRVDQVTDYSNERGEKKKKKHRRFLFPPPCWREIFKTFLSVKGCHAKPSKASTLWTCLFGPPHSPSAAPSLPSPRRAPQWQVRLCVRPFTF